jgi:hypothetical protein
MHRKRLTKVVNILTQSKDLFSEYVFHIAVISRPYIIKCYFRNGLTRLSSLLLWSFTKNLFLEQNMKFDFQKWKMPCEVLWNLLVYHVHYYIFFLYFLFFSFQGNHLKNKIVNSSWNTSTPTLKFIVDLHFYWSLLSGISCLIFK